MDLTLLTNEELFEQYRLGLIHRNSDQVRSIVMEYGRRGLDNLNGEPLSQVFSRNPLIQIWYEQGKGI